MLSRAATPAAVRPRPARPPSSLAWLVLVALALAACSGEDEVRDGRGTVVNAGTWSVFDLRDGDCLDPDPDVSGEVADVPVVPCSQPHLQEVFATIEHPEGPYPGASAVSLWADGACLAQLEADYGLTLDDGLFVSYLLPTFVGWNKDDDRGVICVLVFPDRGGATGSVVAGTADITPSAPVDPSSAVVDAAPAEGAP